MLHLAPRPEWHPIFESLGYALGFAAYRTARRSAGDVITQQQRWEVIAAAIVGAVFGSRFLGLWNAMPIGDIRWSLFFAPTGGKTIVGGLLGGWLAVEITKRVVGIQSRTGDLFAIPLCIGIAVGRMGCLLAGLADDTYGRATSLPWGTDFRGRHCTASDTGV